MHISAASSPPPSWSCPCCHSCVCRTNLLMSWTTCKQIGIWWKIFLGALISVCLFVCFCKVGQNNSQNWLLSSCPLRNWLKSNNLIWWGSGRSWKSVLSICALQSWACGNLSRTVFCLRTQARQSSFLGMLFNLCSLWSWISSYIDFACNLREMEDFCC